MRTRWMQHDEPSNRDIRDEIMRLLFSLKNGESICPSDVARGFGPKWRELMPLVREVASDLVRDGAIDITQNGQIVDVDERDVESIKGPIRLRRHQSNTASASESDEA